MAEPAAAADAPASAGLRLIAALALSSALAPLNSTMLSVVLGPIGRELDVPDARLTQLLVTSYLITSIVMQAPAGKLGDRLGHRRALAIGQVGVALGAVAGLLAPSVELLAAARVLMATGGALVVPSATALLRLELPPERRGRAFGAFGASMALAAAIGPVLGGAIEWAVSWRATFLVNLLVLPIAALLARSDGAERPPPRGLSGMRIDGLGALLLGGALAAVVIGAALEGPERWLVLAGAGALAVVFVAWERRHPEPIMDLALLRRPVLTAGGLVIALHNLAMYALLFELPRTLERVLELRGHESGPLLGAMMISMVIASPISGRLSDRMGARPLAVGGTLLALFGIALLLLVPLTSVWSVLPSLVALGLGLGIASAPTQAAAMSAAPREGSGMAAALLSTLRYLGGVAGIVLLGVLQSSTEDREVALREHQHAVMLFAAALAIAVACAMVLPRASTKRN